MPPTLQGKDEGLGRPKNHFGRFEKNYVLSLPGLESWTFQLVAQSLRRLHHPSSTWPFFLYSCSTYSTWLSDGRN